MIRRAADHQRIMAELENEMKPYPKPVSKAKKPKNPPIDKADILTRRGMLCDCGCRQWGYDLHHCFLGRRKGYPILDDERNLVYVNADEHRPPVKKFDKQIWRVFFWEVQCLRYGEKAMLEWIDAVLAAGLDKSRIDWL
jgi:hypothetical protein